MVIDTQNMTITFFILVLMVALTHWAQCPATVDTSSQLVTKGFTYSLMTGAVTTNGIVWADSTWVYMLINGDISGSEHSLILKMDGNFDVVWEKALIGSTSHDQIALTSDESSLIISLYSTSSCHIIKINTIDGSIAIQKKIGTATRWNTMTLKNDESEIYVAGVHSSNKVFTLNSADFAVIQTMSATMFTLSSIYSYSISGAEKLLINGNPLLGLAYEFIGADLGSNTKDWGKSLTCLLTCSASEYIKSLILNTTDQSIQLTLVSGTPIFYIIDLVDGSVSGSFYKANLGESNMIPSDLSYSATNNTVIILIKHNDGMHKIEYDISTSSFTSSYTISTEYGYFIKENIGMLYIGGNVVATNAIFITKLIGNGENSLNSDFVMTLDASTFTSSGLHSIFNGLGLSVSTSSGPSSLVSSLTFTDPGVYTISTIDSSSSDVVYQGGFTQTIYIQESYTGLFPFDFPWSISGATSITSSIIAHPSTGTFPAWVAVHTDNENLDVTTPSIDLGTTYYFSTRSVILSENVDQEVTLIIYSCQVDNWDTCDYTSQDTCNIWNTGYDLSNDASECVIPPDEEDDEAQVPQLLSETNTMIVIAGTAVPVAGAVLMVSSPSSIFGLINQYQLLLILPFLNWYLPAKFVSFLHELDITLMNFEFLPEVDIPYLESGIKSLDYPHPHEEFTKNGVKSGSFIMVNRFVVKMFLILFCCNIAFLCIYVVLRKYRDNKWFKVTIGRVFKQFHASIYIRTLLESWVFGIMVAMSEAYRVDQSHLISWGISLIYIVLVISWLVSLFFYSVMKKAADRSMLVNELFEGFKNGVAWQLYYTIFLLRRLLIGTIMIIWRESNIYIKLGVFGTVQFTSFLYLVILRPFEGVQDNILDVCNDFIYIITFVLVTSIQDEKLRDYKHEEILPYLVVANCVLVLIINVVFLAFNLIAKCRKKKKIISAQTDGTTQVKVMRIIKNLRLNRKTVSNSITLDYSWQENTSREFNKCKYYLILVV